MVRSQDYLTHISKVQRTPSILTDVPRYPSAHLAFRNKKVVYEQTTSLENGVEVVYVENEDAETNQYYPMKNKQGLVELQKWKPLGLNELMSMNLVSYAGNSTLQNQQYV